MKKERLYLKRNEYNNYRIIDALAKIVKAHNGYEVASEKPFILEPREYTITDRTIYNKINELLDRVRLSEKFLKEDYNGKTQEEQEQLQKLQERTKENIKAYNKEIEELKKIADNETTTTTHANYISFYYDNYIYCVQLNENPFFEHYFTKACCYTDGNKKIVDYSYYGTHVNVDEVTDYVFNDLSNEDIKELANVLWNITTSMKESEKATEKIKVQNTYNYKYHYETILKKNKTSYVKI